MKATRFDKIMIVVDEHPCSKSAVQQGYELAAGLGAQVVLVDIVDAALAMGDVDAGIFPDEALQRKKGKAENMLRQMQHEYGGKIQSEIITRTGETKTVIPQLIAESGAKMIVIGAHRHTWLNRLIEGNPEESMLLVSTVPVLVVPKI
ncbi:MAG TPA: universal stress protein [Mucilaginibacter sp.]|nr:universal stress protein [Mucilaginibacter sp.]